MVKNVTRYTSKQTHARHSLVAIISRTLIANNYFNSEMCLVVVVTKRCSFDRANCSHMLVHLTVSLSVCTALVDTNASLATLHIK